MAYQSLVKDVNLLLSLNKKPRKVEKKSSNALSIFVIVLLILIMGGIYAFFIYKTAVLEDEVGDIEKYMQSQEIIDEKVIYDEVFNQSVELNVARLQLVEVYEKYNKTQPFNINTLNAINSAMLENSQVLQFSYHREENELNITVTTPNIGDINKIVKNVNAKDILEDVSYTGYEYGSHGNLYSFVIKGKIKEVE